MNQMQIARAVQAIENIEREDRDVAEGQLNEILESIVPGPVREAAQALRQTLDGVPA